MSATTPDVIVIRGAPGSGKSQTSKCLAPRFQGSVLIEVDTLRSMVTSVNWTDQAEHVNVLALSTGLALGFLRLGYRPVIVVDTFSGNKLARFLADLMSQDQDRDVRAFALVTSPEVLTSRVVNRPAGQFKDIAVCEKLNADTRKHLQPTEQVIDNTALTPEETAELVLRIVQSTNGSCPRAAMSTETSAEEQLLHLPAPSVGTCTAPRR